MAAYAAYLVLANNVGTIPHPLKSKTIDEARVEAVRWMDDRNQIAPDRQPKPVCLLVRWLTGEEEVWGTKPPAMTCAVYKPPQT